MTAMLKNDISAKEAQKLWGLLRQHFINFERTLEEIIEKRAWEPMGYESFPEAWTAQMGDVTLAAEFRPHVVYAYFDQGASIEEVAAGVKGIGRDRAESLKRQKNNGVPAGLASLNGRHKWHNKTENSTTVREHERRIDRAAPGTIRLSVGPTRLARYKAIAKRHGSTVEELSLQAIEAAFDGMR